MLSRLHPSTLKRAEQAEGHGRAGNNTSFCIPPCIPGFRVHPGEPTCSTGQTDSAGHLPGGRTAAAELERSGEGGGMERERENEGGESRGQARTMHGNRGEQAAIQGSPSMQKKANMPINMRTCRDLALCPDVLPFQTGTSYGETRRLILTTMRRACTIIPFL